MITYEIPTPMFRMFAKDGVPFMNFAQFNNLVQLYRDEYWHPSMSKTSSTILVCATTFGRAAPSIRTIATSFLMKSKNRSRSRFEFRI